MVKITKFLFGYYVIIRIVSTHTHTPPHNVAGRGQITASSGCYQLLWGEFKKAKGYRCDTADQTERKSRVQVGPKQHMKYAGEHRVD